MTTDHTTDDVWLVLERAPQVFARAAEQIRDLANQLDAARVRTYIGCGSSLDVAEAALRTGTTNRALSGGDGVPARHDDELTIMVTRSGTTRELVEIAESQRPDIVLTCAPSSPVAHAAKQHVVDLSAALDPGFVASLSTLVTFAAIALIEAPPHERDQVAEELTSALRHTPDVAQTPVQGVVWLGPWSSSPMGRELVRKTAESGRQSFWSHSYEFLHGHDLLARSAQWEWVVMDTPRGHDRFRDLASTAHSAAPVRLIEHDWTDPAAPRRAQLLYTAYALLFRPSGGNG